MLLTRLPEVGGGAPGAGLSSPPGTLLPQGPGWRLPSGSPRPRQRRAGPHFKEFDHEVSNGKAEQITCGTAACQGRCERSAWLVHARRAVRDCRPRATWSPIRDIYAHGGHDHTNKINRNSLVSSHTQSLRKFPRRLRGQFVQTKVHSRDAAVSSKSGLSPLPSPSP